MLHYVLVLQVLLLMQFVYTEVKSRQPPNLSVSQFRALAFLKHRPGASLSEVAEYVGTSPPSTSKMIDGLVERDLVVRQTSATDRRRITLTLTAQGGSILESVRQGIQTRVAAMLRRLPEADRATIVQAMQAVRPVCIPVEGNQA